MLDHIPTRMPTSNRPVNAGSSMDDDASRLDGAAKVTGLAKYGKDMHLPNALYAALVRCPCAAGALRNLVVEKALAVPGVVDALITEREATYHGQSIGYIAADSPLALKRGLRALGMAWRRTGPVKTRIEDSEPAPNLGAGEEGVDGAAFVHEAVYSTPVQTHSSLESHGGCVDHRGDRATVYASTQGTSSVRDGLAKPLGLRDSEFEVVCEYVGGGFGSKLGGPGKEITTAAKIAAAHKRPVYLFCDRKEEHLDTGNRPSSRTLVRVAFKKDGTITKGEVRTWGGVGVGRGGGGVVVPSGRYQLGSLNKKHEDVNFNAGGPRPFRAPGHPQGAFAEELMLDEIAAKAGVDPLELRRRLVRNEVYREMFDLGSRLIGWKDRKANGSGSGIMRVGFGMGTASWGSPGPGGSAEVAINRDGSVESRTGTQDIGTGQRTTMGIVTAAALGVPLGMVTVRIGRSTLPPGPGSGGSVTSPMTAPTMTAAAEAARDKLLARVASQTKLNVDDLAVKDGAIVAAGRALMTWAEACATLPPEGVKGTGKGGDEERGTGASEGAQFVRLVVDTETGVIHVKHVVAIQSCGRVICRKTAESQVIGGVIQGLSYALFENKILDRNTGSMVNPNLEMYKILGSVDMPHIEPVLWARGQTGVRSLGEPPTIPTAGATACAVFNAIGRPVRDLPLTPDKVLAAMEGGAA